MPVTTGLVVNAWFTASPLHMVLVWATPAGLAFTVTITVKVEPTHPVVLVGVIV